MGTTNTIILVDGEAPPSLIPSRRFTLALLVFFAFIIQYAQRVNLPIGIVCMVNRTKVLEQRLSLATEITINNDVFVHVNNDRVYLKSTTIKPILKQIEKFNFLDEKQFNWVEFQQQILLGGYWSGYIFTQIPGTFIDLHPFLFPLYAHLFKLI